VIWHAELQPGPAAPWGFRFWHTLTQALKLQLTAASTGGAKAAMRPKMNTVDSKASDKRRNIDPSRNRENNLSFYHMACQA